MSACLRVSGSSDQTLVLKIKKIYKMLGGFGGSVTRITPAFENSNGVSSPATIGECRQMTTENSRQFTVSSLLRLKHSRNRLDKHDGMSYTAVK